MMERQTRVGSLIETITNTLVGLGVGWVSNLVFLPMFGLNVTGSQALSIGAIFTAISIVRGYCIRRWFEGRIRRFSAKIAGRGDA
jgi:hypothetical protein